jgi:hypothetical protein
MSKELLRNGQKSVIRLRTKKKCLKFMIRTPSRGASRIKFLLKQQLLVSEMISTLEMKKNLNQDNNKCK